MGDIVLTNEAELLACELFNKYVERRADGEQKAVAKRFDIECGQQFISRWSREDARETLNELLRAFPPERREMRRFTISDAFIVYMEGRFGRKADKVLARIAQIKAIIF